MAEYVAEYVERRTVFALACRGCTRHGDELGICFDSEPCERLGAAFMATAPVDAALVVRCKSCQNLQPLDEYNWLAGECTVLHNKVTADFFCAFGKLKDGGG